MVTRSRDRGKMDFKLVLLPTDILHLDFSYPNAHRGPRYASQQPWAHFAYSPSLGICQPIWSNHCMPRQSSAHHLQRPGSAQAPPGPFGKHLRHSKQSATSILIQPRALPSSRIQCAGIERCERVPPLSSAAGRRPGMTVIITVSSMQPLFHVYCW
jgi:hypothetical protein